MQIGDLVELSSAGRKSQQNWTVKDTFGMLVQIKKQDTYPYVVEWYGVKLSKNVHNPPNTLPCKRYELKKLRIKK